MKRFLTDILFLILVGLLCLLSYGLIAGMRSHGTPGNYTRAIENVLIHEGGAHYTNIKADPGGPTKYGITLADLRIWRGRATTADDVKNMTEEEARQIYRIHYAKVIRFDELPPGLDYTLFDYSVNAGFGRAVPDLARVLKVPATQRVTNEMVTAMHILPVGEVIQLLNARRMAFQMGLGSRFNIFKKGWANRINSVNRIALSMAGVQMKAEFNDGTFDMIPRIGQGKAYIEETQ